MGNKQSGTGEPETSSVVPVFVEKDELTLTQHSDDINGIPRKAGRGRRTRSSSSSMDNKQSGTGETEASTTVSPAPDELSLTQHPSDKDGVPRKVKTGKGTSTGTLKSGLSLDNLAGAAEPEGMKRVLSMESLATDNSSSANRRSLSTKKADKAVAAAADTPTAGRLARSLSMESLGTASTTEKSGTVKAKARSSSKKTDKAANVSDPLSDGGGGRMTRVLTVNSFGSFDNLLSEFPDGASETLLVDVSSLKGTTFAGRGKKGYTASNPNKPNQDAFWMFHDPATSSLVVAVFDGHGQFGHDVSAYCKTYFRDHLPSHPTFVTNLHRAIHDTIERLERDMLAAPHIDTIFSGTTLTLAVVRGTVLTVANVGDSRAVAGVQLRTPKKGGSASAASGPFHVLQLTEDHKPELVEEKKRIVSSGGRVDMVNGCGRVYLATEDVPGLAMSRSLGDYVAHDAGVSSTPDIHDYDLTGLPGIASGRSGDFLRVSLLVATDGVFDVMSNEDAVATALQHWEEPGAAVDDILAVTDATWRTKWNVIDDTSVCVVNIECL